MPEVTSAVGYIRVSTERQADEVRTSLEDQRSAIVELAGRLEAEVVEWFTDAGASGSTADRPGFRALLRWCEDHARPASSPGYVLVLNDSRFGRFPEPEEAGYWRHQLRLFGWSVRFCEGDDVEGDFRTVVRAIGSVQATEYRRNLIANTRRGMKGAAEQGYWTREAPFGFRRIVVHPQGSERVLELGQLKAPNEKVRLTPHPEESAIVRWAFETYAVGGTSLGTLATELLVKCPRRRWGRTVVATMLKNPAYRGAVVGGRRRDGEDDLYGCENAHEAIISPRLWNAVQARLGKNQERGRGVRSHYLVSGLMTCPHCSEVYTGGGGGRSRTKNPERSHRRFYRDSGGIANVCPGRIGTVTRHLVDDAVIDVVGSTITKPSVRRRIERAIDDALDGASGSVGASLRALGATRRRSEARRDRLVSSVADGTVLPHEAAHQLEAIRANLADVDAQIQALQFAARRATGVRSERDRLLQLAIDFPGLAARLTGPALRELVEPWLGSVTFDKVTRTLSLGIRPIPAVPSLVPYGRRGPSVQNEVRLLTRSTSLVQSGHEHRVAEAAEEVLREDVG